MKRLNFSPLQRGFSLVELLVSMLIAGVVLSGVVAVVQSSRVAFTTEQESAFIQENVRYAAEILARDIRNAGNSGCASLSNTNTFSGNVLKTDISGLVSSEAVRGFEGTLAIDPAEWPDAFEDDAVVGSDAFIVTYADPGTAVSIQSHNASSAVLKLHSDHDFRDNDTLIIVDSTCRNVTVFEMTSGESNGDQIGHNQGTTPNIGNCTKKLYPNGKRDMKCGDLGGTNPSTFVEFPVGSRVMEYVAHGYYIGESNVVPGVLALKRRVLDNSVSRSEELAQGVERMELLFGVDTDDPTDGQINEFVDADNIPDIDGDTEPDLDHIFAVRFSVVFRSQSEVYDTDQSITLLGETYTDKFMRQIASATVRIRNRQPEDI
jgi:type IV pilus assembly protein PilW